jgi:soluble lytic murein transglycosylase
MHRKAATGYKRRMSLLRFVLPMLPLLLLRPAAAQDVAAPLRDEHWAAAQAAAAQYADPVVPKLVTYYRLLSPGAASASEIAAFMANNPDWPLPGSLARRRDEALAAEADDAAAASDCGRFAPQAVAALARCADAYAHTGRDALAAETARRAWVAEPADAAEETQFLKRWRGVIGAEDQWRRFERLAWSDTEAAKRQAARLDPADRSAAAARLALRRDDPAGATLVAALSPARRSDPALVLEQARWLRRANQDEAALAFWQSAGNAAERAVTPDRLAAFWDERSILARRRLHDGDAVGAYALVASHAQTAPEQVGDAEFLAGFIALHGLRDPGTAMPHFATLARLSKAALTQSRAHYWLGRAAAAGNDAARSSAEYALAAAWPSTFYGQLAALALADNATMLDARITGRHDPGWDTARALALVGRELARAAVYLVSWNEPERAQSFLLRLADIAPDGADLAMAARLAAGFGLTETTITIARRAGRDGVVLLDTGWPAPVDVPGSAGVETALALGIIRQESSFETTTVSPVGARGLMQLMPATAALVARKLRLAGSVPALTADPGTNMQLGTAYLRDLLDQFDGVVPLAVAAYNAGPGRVQEWLRGNGDPRAGGVDMIDWIELIPFGETRNYVQRVIENQVVYRARSGEERPHPLSQWLR